MDEKKKLGRKDMRRIRAAQREQGITLAEARTAYVAEGKERKAAKAPPQNAWAALVAQERQRLQERAEAVASLYGVDQQEAVAFYLPWRRDLEQQKLEQDDRLFKAIDLDLEHRNRALFGDIEAILGDGQQFVIPAERFGAVDQYRALAEQAELVAKYQAAYEVQDFANRYGSEVERYKAAADYLGVARRDDV